MIEKGKLYRLFVDTTPPILLRKIKKTDFYRSIAKKSDSFTSIPPSKAVVATGGDIKGFTLKLNPDGAWQNDMISGEYDSELFDYMRSLNLNSKVIYDIGAHIGYHSLIFSRYVGSGGHIYAFEPNAVNSARLKEIIALNPEVASKITVQEIALSNTSGTATFLCTNDLEVGSSTGGFLNEASTIWKRSVYVNEIAFKEITVQQETIDNLVSSKKILPPNLLKIDVEGAEQLVLAGAMETIKNYHPIILVEFHSIFSTYTCMLILEEHGYKHNILKREDDGRIMIVATYGEQKS